MFFASLPALPPPIFDFRVEAAKGLIVESGGVPLIRGSYLQYYKPDWSKGYFSTAYGPQTFQTIDSNTIKLSYVSDDGLAEGAVTYHRMADRLTIHYDLGWKGDEPVNVEVASGFVWAPALERGTLTANGKATRALNTYSYAGEGIGNRRFADDSAKYEFSAPVGVVSESSSIPLTLFDARGYNQDWAVGHQYWWLGSLAIPVSKGKPASFDVNLEMDVTERKLGDQMRLPLNATPDESSLLPDSSRPPMIPKPQSAKLDWAHPLAYTGSFAFPAGEFDHYDSFKSALARRFQVPAASTKGKPIAFDGGISKLGLVPGGYRLTIEDHSISVLGEEDEGLRNGLERLSAIAFVSNGKICFPTGTIVDQPQTDWRGVHLFVGNQATDFQTKLWNRVLRPLGFNKVVLECERTNWESVPGIAISTTMSKADLIRLFKFYRSIGVDPIPLVQSYGHMEWFFANKSNLDVARSPQNPYAVDPNNPRTGQVLTKLWAEIVEALHPDIVHFGLDEVNMVGPKGDPQTETKLWAKQLGLLESIAKANNVEMMLWGDQGLAPGEAPDATNGETKTDAATRREAIPRGSYIGDWHYTGEAKSTDYRKNLQLWKDAGMKPIASTWFNPSNIAAFDPEAGLLNCGTLQTTWCGFESSEAGMLQGFNQFSAMILAADYSWSGRKESPSQLDYDPAMVFRKMYFGEPSPLAAVPGFGLSPANSAAASFNIGKVHYAHPFDASIASNLINAEEGHGGLTFPVETVASRLEIACNTLIAAAEDGEPVAEIVVQFANGTSVLKKLVYGVDVRATDDKGALPMSDRDSNGVCSVEIPLSPGPVKIKAFAFRPLNLYTGFAVKGVEAIK